MPDPLILAATAVAVILMGFAKGGFSGLGLLALILLSLVMSPLQAAALMLPIMVVQDLVSVWSYRKAFERNLVLVMLAGSVVGIGVGWFIASWVSENAVRVLVGLIAIAFVGVYWKRQALVAAAAVPRQATTGGSLFWGALAGYTSFVAHAGGPPFQVHVMPLRLSPERYAGTNTMFFAVTNMIKVIPYVALGQITRESVTLSAMMFPLAIAATLAGVWVIRRINAARFYTIIYALTLFVGLKLLWDGLRGLMA
ncbi:sulfite exporter TauE/SafE family protein [Alsobacter sp. R-9]